MEHLIAFNDKKRLDMINSLLISVLGEKIGQLVISSKIYLHHKLILQ